MLKGKLFNNIIYVKTWNFDWHIDCFILVMKLSTINSLLVVRVERGVMLAFLRNLAKIGFKLETKWWWWQAVKEKLGCSNLKTWNFDVRVERGSAGFLEDLPK